MKEISYTKPYTTFIIDVFTCITNYLFDSKNSLKTFAEGHNSIYSCCQEYAVLRNSDAMLFYSVFCKHQLLFNIDINEHQLSKSSYYPDEVKLIHSCYPKNIRRWLNGTISRKKICRIDFCILVWCHASGWSDTTDNNTFIQCQKELSNICSKYLEIPTPPTFSMELLWKASSSAYEQSFR